jgi:large subunit ribosomal protein L7/L12
MPTKKKDEAAETRNEETAAGEMHDTPKTSGGAVAKIVEQVETLTVLELSDLVKALETRFGVTAAAPMAFMPGMMAGAGAAAAEVEEKTEFTPTLKEIGPNKIQVIKVVRAITGLGLIEAKKLVEEAPKAIKDAVNKQEAEDIKKKVEEVGGVVEIK